MGVLDVPITALKHDDGREGVLLTKIAAGQLVKVPFSAAAVTYIVGSSSASTQTGIAGNADGSTTAVNMSAATGLGQGSRITDVVYGSVVGVRWKRAGTATIQPFGVIVDGVAHTVRNVKWRKDSVVGAGSTIDQEALVVVASDLDPSLPHSVEIILPSDPYGGTTKTDLFYGWLLEASQGYKDPPRYGSAIAPATLNTTTTALSAASVYRKIMLHNTDTVPHTVTAKYSTAIYKVLTLAAGTSGEIDFGVPVVGISTLTLQADVAGVVNWMPIFAENRS